LPVRERKAKLAMLLACKPAGIALNEHARRIDDLLRWTEGAIPVRAVWEPGYTGSQRGRRTRSGSAPIDRGDARLGWKSVSRAGAEALDDCEWLHTREVGGVRRLSMLSPVPRPPVFATRSPHDGLGFYAWAKHH
jgi:hypothetical protein